MAAPGPGTAAWAVRAPLDGPDLLQLRVRELEGRNHAGSAESESAQLLQLDLPKSPLLFRLQLPDQRPLLVRLLFELGLSLIFAQVACVAPSFAPPFREFRDLPHLVLGELQLLLDSW